MGEVLFLLRAENASFEWSENKNMGNEKGLYSKQSNKKTHTETT